MQAFIGQVNDLAIEIERRTTKTIEKNKIEEKLSVIFIVKESPIQY